MKIIARLTLVAAIVAILLWLVAGPGHRFDLWSFRTGFRLIEYALYFALAGIGLGLIFFAHAAWRQGRLSAFIAFALSLGVAVGIFMLVSDARTYPAIHDISTDLEDPPEFVTIPARPEEERGFPDDQHRALQEVYYPEIAPVETDLGVPQATALVAGVLREMGLDVVAERPEEGRVEATETTFWFGFKDDVVVRIRPASDGDGAVIDIRSVSRVGRSDIGVNAKRIDEITERIKTELER